MDAEIFYGRAWAGNQKLFRTICSRLEKLNCKFVLVEDPYIDRDFSVDFSAFYASTFQTIRKHCVRLHFFREIPGSSSPPWPIQKHLLEEWQSKYLGFVVVRPIAQNQLGRTMIVAETTGTDEQYCCTLTTTEVNINGFPLEVQGMPFMQQDGMVGVCGTTALWQLARYMHLKYGFPWYAPSDITLAANNIIRINRAFPANKGLLPDQIISALIDLGYTPMVYNKKFTPAKLWQPKELIYKYIESGIPVLLVVEVLNQNHACVAIGHNFDPDRPLPNDGWYRSNSELISSFIVHDDAAGPYLLLPETPQGRKTNTTYTINDIVLIIAPVFRKVYMEAYDVADILRYLLLPEKTIDTDTERQSSDPKNTRDTESMDEWDFALNGIWHVLSSYKKHFSKTTRSTIKKLESAFRGSDELLFYRSRFMRSNDFKEDYLINFKEIPEPLGEIYASLNMPRYIWVVDFSLRSSLCSPLPPRGQQSERKVIGEMLLDATGATEIDSLIAIHLPGVVFIDPIYSELEELEGETLENNLDSPPQDTNLFRDKFSFFYCQMISPIVLINQIGL